MDTEQKGGNIGKLIDCFTLVARETLTNSIRIKGLYCIISQSEGTQSQCEYIKQEISYWTQVMEGSKNPTGDSEQTRD